MPVSSPVLRGEHNAAVFSEFSYTDAEIRDYASRPIGGSMGRTDRPMLPNHAWLMTGAASAAIGCGRGAQARRRASAASLWKNVSKTYRAPAVTGAASCRMPAEKIRPPPVGGR